MLFQKVIDHVPDYKEFLTVDELDASTMKLAEKYPDVVQVFEAGSSTKGHPIYCIKIGNGSRNALAFACPHPNEPIGTMMLEYFSGALAENEELRNKLDMTWYIIKCTDPDGTKLNEGWFKGPFTLYNYARNYYRPPLNKQVEWTFPIKYKKLNFSNPIKETKALMNLIENKRPDFIYSLHNGGFGGVFWYLSKDIPKVYNKLPLIADKYEVPLNLGEAEVPYVKKYGPAVFQLISSKDSYDFYEKYITDQPEQIITWGTSSDDYANNFKDTFTLITEVPYFYDPRNNDTSKSDMLRRDAIIKSCDFMEEITTFFSNNLSLIRDDISEDNPFWLSLSDFIAMGGQENQAKRQWALSNKELEQKATVSEVFDNLYTSRFFHMLYLGSFVRLTEYELENTHMREIRSERRETLLKVKELTGKKLLELNDILEKEMHYSPISIQRLVRIQLESGLTTVEALYG